MALAAAGDIVLLRFPQTDSQPGKLRPVLLVTATPAKYDDWLICMISTRLNQAIDGLDDIIDTDDTDFASTGLKAVSLVRVTRLAIVSETILIGSIGSISKTRLDRIRKNISNWILKG